MKQHIPTLLLPLTILLHGCLNISDPSTPSLSFSVPTSTSVPIEETPNGTKAIPTRVLTELESIENEMRQKHGTVHGGCDSDTGEPALPPNANCDQYLWTKSITQTQWENLFPETNFYLIGFKRVANCSSYVDCGFDKYSLIAQQGESRYQVETFDKLLNANGIIINDENRQLVAESAALMWLEEFTQEEIGFVDWQEDNSQAKELNLSIPYNYSTRIELPNGTLTSIFWFDDNCLKAFAIAEIAAIESDTSLYDIFFTKENEFEWQCHHSG